MKEAAYGPPQWSFVPSCIYTDDLKCGPENRVHCAQCSETVLQEIINARWYPNNAARKEITRRYRKGDRKFTTITVAKYLFPGD